MTKIFGPFYKWPNNQALLGSAWYNWLGNATYFYPDTEYGIYYVKIPFVNIWIRTKQ